MPLQTRHIYIYIYGEANFCPDALAKKRGNFSTGEFHSDTRMTASSSGAIFSMKRLANPPQRKIAIQLRYQTKCFSVCARLCVLFTASAPLQLNLHTLILLLNEQTNRKSACMYVDLSRGEQRSERQRLGNHKESKMLIPIDFSSSGKRERERDINTSDELKNP